MVQFTSPDVLETVRLYNTNTKFCRKEDVNEVVADGHIAQILNPNLLNDILNDRYLQGAFA